ncbi:MAG: universal stress protein [Pirellulales bacterium]
MFRSAVAGIKPGCTGESTWECLLELAGEQEWSVHGVAVVDESLVVPSELVPLGAGGFRAERDRDLLEKTRAAADASLSEFAHLCQSRGIPHSSSMIEGSLVDAMLDAQQAADVVLLRYRSKSSDDSLNPASPLHAALKHSVRPAIVFPTGGRTARRNMVIACDGSPQAARALQLFALSGLAKGRTVHLLSIHDCFDDAQRLVEQAARFLLSHDIPAVAHPARESGNVGAQILDHCQQLQAGMLAIGVYGQSSVREFFFGSVTRHVLNRADIPVFVSH